MYCPKCARELVGGLCRRCERAPAKAAQPQPRPAPPRPIPPPAPPAPIPATAPARMDPPPREPTPAPEPAPAVEARPVARPQSPQQSVTYREVASRSVMPKPPASEGPRLALVILGVILAIVGICGVVLILRESPGPAVAASPGRPEQVAGALPPRPATTTAQLPADGDDSAAITRGHQKQTMGSLRTVATAAESYSIDNNAYPAGWGSVALIAALLEPTYVRRVPLLDDWGNELQYRAPASRTEYVVASAGANGSFERDGSWWLTKEAVSAPRVAHDPAADIVFATGSFVQYPELPEEAQRAAAPPPLQEAPPTTLGGRQKWTMGDMRTFATAAESYSIDNNAYPGGWGSVALLAPLLEPTYVKRVPVTDAWGHALWYYASDSRSEYVVVSAGADGRSERDGGWWLTPEAAGAGGGTQDPAADIVFATGSFVQYPAEEPQSAGTTAPQADILLQKGSHLRHPREMPPTNEHGASFNGEAHVETLDPSEPRRISAEMTPPELISRVNPVHPGGVDGAGTRGEVVLECIIGTDGGVTINKRLKSAETFQAAAEAAVTQWLYTPAMLNGQPQAVFLVVRVKFDAD